MAGSKMYDFRPSLYPEEYKNYWSIDEQPSPPGTFDAPHCPAGNHYIVAGFEHQMTKVAKKIAPAFVNENKIISIRISRQMIHALRYAPETN